ncbi:MAG: flotillin family protein [Chloroflexi bacterium]|nr:flotillin family protein [Chloroflexota bacterium]
MMLNPSTFGMAIIAIGGILFVLFIQVGVVASRYQKTGPNQVLVVSGRKHIVINPVTGKKETVGFRIVLGGGTIVWPIIERADVLSLEIVTIDVTSEVCTKDDVLVLVDGVAQVKIRGDEAFIRTAAECLLSKSANRISEIVRDTLLGHMWAVIGTETWEEINKGRDLFTQKVIDVSAVDMANMGLTVVNLSIRNIRKA